MTYSKKDLFIGFRFLHLGLSYEVLNIEDRPTSVLLKAIATNNTFTHSINDLLSGLSNDKYKPIKLTGVSNYEIY